MNGDMPVVFRIPKREVDVILQRLGLFENATHEVDQRYDGDDHPSGSFAMCSNYQPVTVLTRASNDFVLGRVQFVRDVLSTALQIGEEAREQIASALYSAMSSGMRDGAAGEPFPEDLALEADASAVPPTLGRFDPAHDLYRDLLALAQENILRQRRRVEAMDAADEELG